SGTTVASDVRGKLTGTADDLGDSWLYGYGLVNAAKAVGLSDVIPDPPPAGDTMHVESINMELKKAGINVNAIATVTIVDDGSSAPVEGATVSGTWSGATNDTDSGVTDANGKVSLQSSKVKDPSSGTIFTFTVDDVTKDGYTPLINVGASGSIPFPEE
ncbi:MAG: hypothetical protein KAR64_09515, partial [Thermoplasmatales archaeon]|nr:hypothetical protein [Thermoplasmatales archaeon]